MKFAIILFLLISSIYTLSYAKASWAENNKKAAAGAVIIAVASILLPSLLLLFR